MKCNHETRKVKETDSFDVQLQEGSFNQKKTKHYNRESKNDENGFEKFPNFEALTKEEKLEFFEALSFARRNVEKTGTQTRKRFNTVHDEYLDYFESFRGAVTGDIEHGTPSASSCDTQATYTLSCVRNESDIEKAMSRKSFLSLPETVDLIQAEEPTTSKSFSEMHVRDEKLLPLKYRTPLSKYETKFDADQENTVNFHIKKHEKNLAISYESNLLQISKDKKMTKNEVANKTSKQKSFAEEEHGIDEDGFVQIPETELLKKNSNKNIKNVKSTLKFEALNWEEKKIFFTILKEAHDNVYKKETKKGVSPYETILKRYEMDGAPQIEVSTSIAHCKEPKPQFKDKNLRVKLTLTSTDNERLEKAVTTKVKEVDIKKEFLKVHTQDFDKVYETRLLDKDPKKEFYSNSITDFKSEKISKNLDYELNKINLDESITSEDRNTAMNKMNSIADEMSEKPFANGLFEGFEKRDIFKENEDIENTGFSNTSINCLGETNKTEENCLENGNDEKVIWSKTSLVNLAKDDNTSLKSENNLDTNGKNELENTSDAQLSMEQSIKFTTTNQSPTSSCNECHKTNSEKDEILPTKKEELKKSSLCCLSRKIQEISILESLSSSKSSFSRSHSFKQVNKKPKEHNGSKSTQSVSGGQTRKKEENKENFQFQQDRKECHSKAQHAVPNDSKHETTGREIAKVHASLTYPEVFLKVQQNTRKEDNKKQTMTVTGLPRSISDSGIRQNTKLTEVDKSDFQEAQNNLLESESSLILTKPSDSDSASTTESEEDPFLVPMFVKRKRLPTTKIRVLQDLLKERAKFVEGSIGEFKIVRVPNEEIESFETPTARLYVEEEDGHSEKGIKSMFLKALAKFCRCGKKDVGEEENMLENLKGEAVAVDVSKSAKNPASVTLNESTMEVLKAAERKKIIQKYWKIS